MNVKLVSSKQIIGKVFRDMKPDNGSFVADAIEWIGEALEFIGVHSGLKRCVKDITIENHRGALPCNVQFVAAVVHNGSRMGYGSDERLYNPESIVSNPNAHPTVTAAFVTDPQSATDDQPSGMFREVSTNSISSSQTSEYYVVEDGIIRTSLESGTVQLYYLSIPMDCDNFPKVPDNVTVKEALVWYIMRQMLMGGATHPVFDWRTCDYKWEEYCGKAQNDLMFPSVDKVEAFRDMWVNMIPNINAYESFFSDR